MMKHKNFFIACTFLGLYIDESCSMALIGSTTRGASPSLNLPTAEADRALRYAASLENAGMPRTAHALYHESATLYQCLLDSSEFSHVSELEQIHEDGSSKKAQLSKESTLKSYLTYACMRLGYLSHDALSDPRAALRLYKEATTISSQPPAEAFDGVGICIEASGGNLKEAVAAYKKSLAIQDNGMVWFHLAVALERLGEAEEAEEIMESLRRAEAKYACLVDSWGYIRFHTRRTPNEELNLYLGTRDMLKIGIEAAMDLINQNGLLCEFGVATGRSMRIIQEFLPLDTKLHGFDTFTGLPLPWNDLPVGSFSTNGNIPNVDGEVYFHRGLFRDSIPRFLESTADEFQPLAFVNIDVLMYSSTLDILEGMHSRVVAGTVFVFADYTSHPTWRQDEFRAWREACKRFGWRYEYLGFSLATKQAVVRVTSA